MQVLEIGGRIWPVSLYDLLVLAVTAVLVIGLTLLFTKTSLGLSMRASAFNPEVARLSGVRVNRMLITGWAIAGATGAIGGVLIAPFSTISPTAFDILLVFAFTAAVIGGLTLSLELSPLGSARACHLSRLGLQRFGKCPDRGPCLVGT